MANLLFIYFVYRYLLDKNAQIHRETQTGDTALSYGKKAEMLHYTNSCYIKINSNLFVL